MSDELAGAVERVRSALRESPPEVLAVYLFGSVARGSGGSSSDLDLGVLYDQAPPATLAGGPLDLEGELERAARRPVELVVLNTAPADLVHRVLRDGQLLLDRAPARRIAFEVRRRAEFLDLLPTLRSYRRATGDRAS